MHVHPVRARRWVGERNHFVRVTVSGLAHASRSDINEYIEVRTRRRDEALIDPNSQELEPRRDDDVLMNGASRIVWIKVLVRILCYCFGEGSRRNEAACGKVQRAVITCRHVVCDAGRGPSHFGRCSYRDWLNNHW